MKTITNKFKIALVAVGLLTIGTVSAQRDAAAVTAGANANFTKQGNPVFGDKGGAVKVVDNKGTIKYLQGSNGVTLFTDTAPDGGIVTTWQIGGTLTDDTYIDVSGKAFAIDGIELVNTTTLAPSTDAASLSSHGTGTGFTILVRDEVTGATKKLLASDIVSGVRTQYIQGTDTPITGTADANGNATSNIGITVAGLPVLTVGTTFAKLFVYRNGVKLRTISDFVATAGVVTIQFSPTDLPMYNGDIIEIQYIK